jgi:dTDP-glucose 4,6-dehydratase
MGADLACLVLEENLAADLTIIDNFSYSANKMRLLPSADKFRILRADIRDYEAVLKYTIGADLVFNFAAETHNDNSINRPLDFFSTNTQGVICLLQAARENQFHLHQISTDEVFGDLPLESDTKFNEDSPLRPSSPYSASKAAAEMLVYGWVRTFGVSASISNSSNNYGNFQHEEKLIPNIFSKIRNNQNPQLYGSGKNIRDWINVRDHSRAVWRIATGNRSSLRYCISSGQLYSNHDLARMINLAFGRNPEDIDFIADRPGHDLKYSSDSSLLQMEMGWSPREEDLETFVSRRVSES